MAQIICAGLSTLFFPVLISDSSLMFSNSMFSVLLFGALFLLLRRAGALPADRRLTGFTHALGFLFSLMTAYGYALEHLGAIPYLSLALNVSILLYTHIFAQMLALLFQAAKRNEPRLLSAQMPSGRFAAFFCRFCARLFEKPFLLPSLFLLCWAPCYISTFPGNLIYDASYEYYQLANGFTRSFPLLHSAIITRLFSASEHFTGSVNAGVAVYIVAQMLLMAQLFSHIVRRFRAQGLHPALLGVMILYYAAFPVIHLLVTCTTRDVLFSALLTWLVYLFYCLGSDTDRFMSSGKNVVLLAAVLVFTLLARNNNSGPLAALLLLFVCGLVCLFHGRKHIRRSIMFIASALGLFWSVSAALAMLCQPLYDSPPSSSMSMLAQPIVRAYTLHADEWSPEDRAAFESFFTMETLEYVPQNADPAKGNLQVRYANLREFIALWIRIGLRHPACYLDAVLENTRQMWFPSSIPDGYNVRGMYPGYDKCYFYFGRYVEEIGSRLNLLPAVFSFYEKIGLMISYEKLPVVSMFFSIGSQIWLLLYCVFYAAYRKCRPLLWPLMIICVYTICCAFVPLVLLRYFGALFFVFPMILVFSLCPSVACKKDNADA